MKPIYLDHNATTPVDRVVADAMMPYLAEEFGNPSSGHPYGLRTRAAVETARGQVAGMLGCLPEEITFTSGGTEANNHAIRGYVIKYRDRGNHIITSQIEHPAVLEVCEYLEEHGFSVTYLPVDQYGMISLDALANAIRNETILITIMLANNEVGTIQPITEIAEVAAGREIALHTDAAQAIGKIPVEVDALGVDMLSIAGHKLYAPKGIGALYVKSGVDLEKFMLGADHESNRRAGTENVLEIVGLGKACELVNANIQGYARNMRRTRDKLQLRLTESFPSASVNGHPEHRLPNTLSISFPGIEANQIISEATGVAISAGAACHSDVVEMSHVLKAMGLPEETAMGTLRISTGRSTTDNEVDRAFEELSHVVSRLSGGVREIAVESHEGIRLTRYTQGLGCACKLRPQLLEEILRSIPAPNDSNVMVGTETADDAAVYRITDDIAIVQTVDFFTPVVDDPYEFGQIAAANSLSDVYAMGAKPVFALSVVGFPSNRLPISVLNEILQGAHDKAAEAGVSIIGGHTIDDVEPKYGLAVTGTVHPNRVWLNSGAKPGNAVILGKPIGTGILSTALKRGVLSEENRKTLIEQMASLNDKAARILAEYDVHACTDVTGFGLLGHLHEMTQASGVEVEIESSAVPIMSGAREHAASGIIPGGTEANVRFLENKVSWTSGIGRTVKVLMCDAQTSGGLLAAVESDIAEEVSRRIQAETGMRASVIGRVVGKGTGRTLVL